MKALCPDGKLRHVRTAAFPDTWFSLPARVKYKGKTVAGFITPADGMAFCQEHEPEYKFHPYLYRKNGRLFTQESEANAVHTTTD